MCALNVLSRCLQLLVSGRGEADLAAVAENGVARIQVDLADVGEVARSTGEIASASVYVHGIIENRVQPRACHCLFSRCGGLIYEDGVAVLSHEMMLNGEKRGAAGTGRNVEDGGGDRAFQVPIGDAKSSGLTDDSEIGHDHPAYRNAVRRGVGRLGKGTGARQAYRGNHEITKVINA